MELLIFCSVVWTTWRRPCTISIHYGIFQTLQQWVYYWLSNSQPECIATTGYVWKSLTFLVIHGIYHQILPENGVRALPKRTLNQQFLVWHIPPPQSREFPSRLHKTWRIRWAPSPTITKSIRMYYFVTNLVSNTTCQLWYRHTCVESGVFISFDLTKIPSFAIKDLINSMPRRRQAIINSNGAPSNISFFGICTACFPLFSNTIHFIYFGQRWNNLSIITFESRGRKM